MFGECLENIGSISYGSAKYFGLETTGLNDK